MRVIKRIYVSNQLCKEMGRPCSPSHFVARLAESIEIPLNGSMWLKVEQLKIDGEIADKTMVLCCNLADYQICGGQYDSFLALLKKGETEKTLAPAKPGRYIELEIWIKSLDLRYVENLNSVKNVSIVLSLLN